MVSVQALINTKGAGDLSVYFFKRALILMKEGGVSGLIATDTFIEGDTQRCGPDHLLNSGASFARAITSLKWPGAAAVNVCVVHAYKGDWAGGCFINNKPVKSISALLSEDPGHMDVVQLSTRKRMAAKGVTPLGDGFVLSPSLARELCLDDERNHTVIKPYLIGQDFNTDVLQRPSRFLIDFGDMSEDEARSYRLPFARVEELVRPVRERLHRQIHESCFWKHWDRRTAFLSSLPKGDVLVTSLISKHWALAFVANGYVYDQKVVVFAENTYQCFCIYQSNIHEAWARREGGLNIGPTPSYTVSTNFNTFAPPEGFPSNLDSHTGERLGKSGERYHAYRSDLMQQNAEGLTKTYNRFHNYAELSADIAELRSLHIELDRAVAAAYGWDDLDLGHDFHGTKQGARFTISETARREVLDRLLELNHQRYAEEVAAGLHDKKAKKPTGAKRGRKRKAAGAEPGTPVQTELF
ncbi:type IIL restriction-modification enzyme MmeI [Thiocapsa marina]|nr:hypothetical protein [Thiocapsa marina]